MSKKLDIIIIRSNSPSGGRGVFKTPDHEKLLRCTSEGLHVFFPEVSTLSIDLKLTYKYIRMFQEVDFGPKNEWGNALVVYTSTWQTCNKIPMYRTVEGLHADFPKMSTLSADPVIPCFVVRLGFGYQELSIE